MNVTCAMAEFSRQQAPLIALKMNSQPDVKRQFYSTGELARLFDAAEEKTG
jgi:hypothetical protein